MFHPRPPKSRAHHITHQGRLHRQSTTRDITNNTGQPRRALAVKRRPSIPLLAVRLQVAAGVQNPRLRLPSVPERGVEGVLRAETEIQNGKNEGEGLANLLHMPPRDFRPSLRSHYGQPGQQTLCREPAGHESLFKDRCQYSVLRMIVICIEDRLWFEIV